MKVKALLIGMLVSTPCRSMENDKLPGYLVPEDAHQTLFSETIRNYELPADLTLITIADRYSRDGSKIVAIYGDSKRNTGKAKKLVIFDDKSKTTQSTTNLPPLRLQSPLAFLETKNTVVCSVEDRLNTLVIVDIGLNTHRTIDLGEDIGYIRSSFDEESVIVSLRNGDIVRLNSSSWDPMYHYEEQSEKNDGLTLIACNPAKDQFVRYHNGRNGSPTIHWWEDGARMPTHVTETKPIVRAFSYNPNGTYLAYATHDSKIKGVSIVNTDSKQTVQKWSIEETESLLVELCFLPDNVTVASAFVRKCPLFFIQLRDSKSGALLQEITSHAMQYHDLIVNPFYLLLQHGKKFWSIEKFMEGYASINKIRRSGSLAKGMLVLHALRLQSLTSRNEEEQKELEAALSTIINSTTVEEKHAVHDH